MPSLVLFIISMTLEMLRQFDDARNMATVWKETSKVTTRVILLVRIILWSIYTQTTTACVFNKQYLLLLI